MATQYGTGLLYGASEPYGRIDAELSAAQLARVRETGLRVKITDNHINDWVPVAGSYLNPTLLDHSGINQEQDYNLYALPMGMCVLSNGNIIRVRVGDGSSSDRNAYVQVITDPTVAGQWTSWTLYAAGTFYAIAVVPASASTYHIYTADDTNVLKNNASAQELSGVISISPVQGAVDALFATVVRYDEIDNERQTSVFYTPDVVNEGFGGDHLNYRFNRTQITALLLDDERVARVQVGPFGVDARSMDLAESLVVCFGPSIADIIPIEPPRLIRGFAGQAGFNAISHPFLTKLSDGFYYLFYTETRLDASKDVAINISTLFWQRSKDLLFWSEPTAIGYDSMGQTGIAVVETDDNVYLANCNESWTRPKIETIYDISNYVFHAELHIAPTGEIGSATLTLANPAGVNDYLKDFGDRPITIEPGLLSAGTWQFANLDQWWIERVKQETDGPADRLVLTAYDINKKLSNPLRDMYNFVGQTVFEDLLSSKNPWMTTAPINKLFNYLIQGFTGEAPVLIVEPPGDHGISFPNEGEASYTTLYTGWKGHSSKTYVRIYGGTINCRVGIIYRRSSATDFYWAYVEESELKLVRYRDGGQEELGSFDVGDSITAPFNLFVDCRYAYHDVYLDGVLRISVVDEIPLVAPGYSGVKYTRDGAGNNLRFNSFTVVAWETPYTTDDLVKTALAMGDLHDFSVSAGEELQLAIVWGPQTDSPDPFTALKRILDQHKLDLIWRDGVVSVGQFTDPSIIKTIEDELIEFQVVQDEEKHINLAVIDGQEDTYIAIDGADTRSRGRQIVAYFDIPELTTSTAVVARANEELRRGLEAVEYQGRTPLFFDLWRMDAATWIDRFGTARNLRIKAIDAVLDQGRVPQQEGVYTLVGVTVVEQSEPAEENEPPGETIPPPPGPDGYDLAPDGTPEFTGAAAPTDTSAAFAAFLAAHPGEVISLVEGRTYRMDSSTQITNLDGWDLYGQGATILCNVLGSGNQAWLRVVTSDGWRIRDLEVIGPATHAELVDNWADFGWAREDWRGIIIEGGHTMELRRVKAHHFWGDPLYIGRRDSSGDTYATPDGLTLTECEFTEAGRNAVSLVAGRNISATDCIFGNGGLCAWDTEPNLSTDITTGITFTRCRFYGGDMGSTDSASHDSHGNGYPLMISAGSAKASWYSLVDCTFDKGAIYIRRPSAPWNDHISITGCVADDVGDADFDASDTNVTFSGNTNITRVNH